MCVCAHKRIHILHINMYYVHVYVCMYMYIMIVGMWGYYRTYKFSKTGLIAIYVVVYIEL